MKLTNVNKQNNKRTLLINVAIFLKLAKLFVSFLLSTFAVNWNSKEFDRLYSSQQNNSQKVMVPQNKPEKNAFLYVWVSQKFLVQMTTSFCISVILCEFY